MPRRHGPGVFQTLGKLVMHGRNGVSWPAPVYNYEPESAPYIPVEYPVPPTYQQAAQPFVEISGYPIPHHLRRSAVNPAVQAAAQPDVKEGAEARAAHKGTRKAYIPMTGEWLDKSQLLAKIEKNNQDIDAIHPLINKYSEGLRKTLKDRDSFALRKQYNLSKHEPTGSLLHPFGDLGGKASEFYNNWGRIGSQKQDELVAQESALRNSPERLAQKQQRQQAERWAAMPPAEQQQIIYNRQLADYNEAVERNQYMDMMPQQQQQFGQQMGGAEMSPVMLHDLMQGIQSQNTRYVPLKRRRSIHDTVMSSFDPNMFSPEFIPEE